MYNKDKWILASLVHTSMNVAERHITIDAKKLRLDNGDIYQKSPYLFK